MLCYVMLAYARGISCGSRWRRKAERRWAICSWTGSRLACATRTPSSGRPSRPVASTWTRRWSPRRKRPPAASRIQHPPLRHRTNARTPAQGQSRSHFDGTQDMLWSLSLRFNDHFFQVDMGWVSRHQNGSILDFIGAEDDGSDGNNWSYTMCKTPLKFSPLTYQHPTSYRADTLLVGQPPVKHWMKIFMVINNN